MHRHGYKGRKFSRDRDPRRALIKGLASDLFQHTYLTTTLPKAKEIVPYAERLITKAKKASLHSRRQIIAKLATQKSAHLLVDQIAPQLTKRNSGHLRISKLHRRRGDNAQLARVAFVDDIKFEALQRPTVKSKAKPRPVTKSKAEKTAV